MRTNRYSYQVVTYRCLGCKKLFDDILRRKTSKRKYCDDCKRKRLLSYGAKKRASDRKYRRK